MPKEATFFDVAAAMKYRTLLEYQQSETEPARPCHIQRMALEDGGGRKWIVTIMAHAKHVESIVMDVYWSEDGGGVKFFLPA